MNRIHVVRVTDDERGVALPLALLGLVSISLLVTTAILTSSTEYAISAAHEDAARSLYVAEGGLQAFVAENGEVLVPGTTVYRAAGAAEDEAVNVEVLQLARTVLPAGELLRLFSVTAEPVEVGGRRVTSMVRQLTPAPIPLDLNVTSALTLGSDLDVNGNAFTVSGSSTACGSAGVEAARLAADAEVLVNSSNHLDNFTGMDDSGQEVSGAAALQQTSLTREALANDVLQGRTLEEIIAELPASVKWGPRFTPPGAEPRVFDGVVPEEVGVAVIDGDGGAVNLISGSGLVIIVNGNLEMSGNATFDGIILVEGSFWLHGTPTVRGALISLAYDAENRIDLDTESTIASGHITVQYDKCQVDEATGGFGEKVQENQIPQVHATFSWLEVVG